MPILHYNCDDPLVVLAGGIIRASKIHTGVSLSEWSELGSHGPFKITFRPGWGSSAIRVQYWTPARRPLSRSGEPRPLPTRPRNQDGPCSSLEYEARLAACIAQHGARWSRVWKNDVFANEREWYSPDPIPFTEGDVVLVTFMTNAPSIYPRRAAKARKLLAASGLPYEERAVNDPYLKP